jgi:hypothetical protein
MTAAARIALRLGLAAGLIYFSTAGGTLDTSDAVSVLDEATSIVTRGALDVPPGDSIWVGRAGRHYLPFGIGQTLYDIPLLFVGRGAAQVAGARFGDPDTIPKAVVALGSAVAIATAVAFGFLLALRLSGDARASMLAAAALAFATQFWPYSKFGFNAALAAAALAGGLYGVAAGWRTGSAGLAAAGGAGLALALLTRHEFVLAAIIALAWLALADRARTDRRRLLAAAGVPIAIGFLVSCGVNIIRFGRPFFSGHQPGFGTSGFLSFFISPSGALLLYSPVAIAGIGLIQRARRDAVARLLLVVCVAEFVFYASLDDWLGTRSYGPRYLVPLLPLLVAPLAWWWTRARGLRRAALASVIVAGVLIQLPAIVVTPSQAGIAARQPPQTIRRDLWEWSPIRLNARLARSAVPANLRNLAGNSRPQPSAPGSLADRLSYSLNFWWLYLYYLGALSRAAAIAAALVPAVAGATLWATTYARAAGLPAPGPDAI